MRKIGVSVVLLIMSFTALSKDNDTSALMRGMYESIEVIIPYSLSAVEFEKPENRPKIQEELNKFVMRSKALSDHFKLKREDLFFLGFSMSKDAKESAELYQSGKFEQSRFVLHHITNNCVTCHTKSLSKDKKDPHSLFFSNIKNFKLSGFDLADYQTMSRQFNAALNKYEQTFLTETSNLDSKAFGNYLKVALIVKNDPKRVAKFLALLKTHVSDGSRLYDHVVTWKASADDIVKNKLMGTSTLKTARDLVDRGTKIQGYYHDSASIVYYVAASALLLNKLQGDLNKDQQAEIYYFLGVVEDKMPDDFWISETEMYLEQSVRSSPKSPFAKKALGLLEDRFLFEYSGSSGTDLPKEVKDTLKELRNLVYTKEKKLNDL